MAGLLGHMKNIREILTQNPPVFSRILHRCHYGTGTGTGTVSYINFGGTRIGNIVLYGTVLSRICNSKCHKKVTCMDFSARFLLYFK